MVGQEKLINTLTSYSVGTFPHTLLLLGEEGCGKHLVVSEVISPHLNLDVIDITESISLETLLDIELKVFPAMYLIDVTNITDRQQNALLKLLEEPTSSSYFVLISDTKERVLDTILNRCVVYYFEPYSKEQLKHFISNSDEKMTYLTLRVCSTPGQVLELGEGRLEQLHSFCQDFVARIALMSFPEAISLSKSINYKDDHSKFNLGSFFSLLLYVLFEDYQSNNNQLSFELYNLVKKYSITLKRFNLNKEMHVENMLINLWKTARK